MASVLRFVLGLLLGACLTGAAFMTRQVRDAVPTLDDLRAAQDPEPAEAEAGEPELVDVPDEARALAELLLGATEGYGAPELRAQLDEARATLFGGPSIAFEVPGDLPFAVPGDANFPVVGVYRALDDRTFEVYLSVLSGHLSALSISEGRDWTEEQQTEWFEGGRGVHELPGWPDTSELELFIETPDGLAALT